MLKKILGASSVRTNPTGVMEVTRLSYLAASDTQVVFEDLGTRRGA